MSDPLQIEPAVARGRLKEHMWDDPNYLAEEKLDGVRYLWHIHDGHSHFTSRRISVKNGLYVQKEENFPHLVELGKRLPPGTILDGEMMPPDGVVGKFYDVMSVTGSKPDWAIQLQQMHGWLRFVAFDCLYFHGDRRQEPYHKRKDVLRQCVYLVDDVYKVDYPKNANHDKRVFLEEVWKDGGEGVILKNVNAPYGVPTAWVKVKPIVTYDVFIMGYKDAKEISVKVGGAYSPTKFAEKGWIGAVEIGKYVPLNVGGGLVSVGHCSGMDEETREYISRNKEECMLKVIEVKAQEKHPSGALRDPRFVRFREDRSYQSCTMED